MVAASQQADYIFRNRSLDFMCLWDFCAQTEKEKSDPKHCKKNSYTNSYDLLASTHKIHPTFAFMSDHDQYSVK